MNSRGGAEGFRVLPHTSEVGLWIGGRDYKTFLKNAALGLFNILGVENTPGPPFIQEKIQLSGISREEILVDWLNELIFLITTKGLFPSHIHFLQCDDRAVHVALELVLLKKRPAIELKAATYHALRVDRERGVFSARVILDV